jgi:Protein of unknown function (DUF4232)
VPGRKQVMTRSDIWRAGILTGCAAVVLGVAGCGGSTTKTVVQTRTVAETTPVTEATGATNPTAPATATAGAPPSCSAPSLQIWLGVGEGGGFAGGRALPLEFSNVGARTCTLDGYPGVSAYRGALRQVGPAALRIRESPALVTLAPGATAHAFLRIADWGALCSSPVSADGLKVYAPNQRTARTMSTSVAVCAHRAVLAVGAVRSGVGIPGYISQ